MSVPEDDAPTTGRGMVLVVCRANLIRSPLAAAMLRSRLRAAGVRRPEVASAGLHAGGGSTPSPDTVAVAGEWGVDLSTHLARPVTAGDLDTSALVLTMTEEQRAVVTRLAPALTPRTFTLIELVRLLDDQTGTRDWDPGELAARAHVRRPLVAGAAHAEDVPDPVNRGRAQLVGTATVIARSCDRLLAASGLAAP